MRTVSRRQFIHNWLRPFQSGDATPGTSPRDPLTSVPKMAVIAGRDCLAYRGTLCRTCLERCPIEGAITLIDFLPRISPDACTGCGICAEMCPAPVNAIRILPAPKIARSHQ